jgi:adenosine deaminase
MTTQPAKQELHDLHVHLGGAVPAPVLWELLKAQGLESQHTTFCAFQKALTAQPDPQEGLDGFLKKYFGICEQIQSAPEAAETCAYQAMAKIARRSQAKSVEIRFNPAKRTRGNTYHMDAIIGAVTRGIQRACDHYQIEGSTILCLGRDLPAKTNHEILQAALRWKERGVAAIDMAGPESGQLEYDENWLSQCASLFLQASKAGLQSTYHIGETNDSGPDAIERVLHRIRPSRLGHAIQLRKAKPSQQKRILQTLRDTQTCLEICPSVNLVTGAATLKEIQDLCHLLHKEGAPFTIATDNPYLVQTTLGKELALACPKTQTRTWAIENGRKFRFSKP